jgi:hypothetical protein
VLPPPEHAAWTNGAANAVVSAINKEANVVRGMAIILSESFIVK